MRKYKNTNFRIFDDIGAGFISVEKFRVKHFWVRFKAKTQSFFLKEILKEIDEDFTDDELDEVINEVISYFQNNSFNLIIFRSILISQQPSTSTSS